jgi:Flp pilus assembly protein TadG
MLLVHVPCRWLASVACGAAGPGTEGKLSENLKYFWLGPDERRCKHRRKSGQSAVELALTLPVLIVLLLVALDFARLYYMSMEVTDAARAGAQYGAQNRTAAANTLGIEQAACNSMQNISCTPGTNAVATNFCQCSGTTVSCTTPGTCASYVQDFVQVTTSATFSTIVPYPGIASSVPLTGSATMQVQ